VAWLLHTGAGWELLGLVAKPKPVEVASLAAPAHLAGRPSVAVLPFKNLSGDQSQDYFSDGITEDVITALGRFSNLLVTAKSASFPFKGSNASPAEIGRLLDARYLLEGSVRRGGKRVRVSTELTEAATGRHVWSEAYGAEADNIFAVQDDIAKRVVGVAAVKLTHFEQERARTKPTNNLAAYEYVLRGRDSFSHATRDDNDEASELFQRAIDLDPNYPEAYAALERWSAGVGSGNNARLPLARRYRPFQEALRSCLAASGPRAGNQSEQRRHLCDRGSVSVWAGRAAEGLPWLEGALRFDRANDYAAAKLCMAAYYFLGRYKDAVAAGDRALARDPGRNTQMITHPTLAAAYAQLGRQQDADAERAIVAHLWPFLDARIFSEQFGTQEARDHMLERLKKPGSADRPQFA
jgi:TolB-like protein